MKKIYTALLLSLLVGVACVSVKVHPLTQKKYPSKPGDCKLDVLTTYPTHRKVEKIADLTVSTARATTADDLLPALTSKACQLGADALYLQRMELGSRDLVDSTASKASAVALIYLK